MYHIIFKGIGRQNLFEERADYEKMKNILATVKAEIDACKTSEELEALFRSYDNTYRVTTAQVKKANATETQKYLYRMIRQMEDEIPGLPKASAQGPYVYYWSWMEEVGFISHAS